MKNITTELVSPEIAKRYLLTNNNNRKFSQSTVDYYAKMMKNGEWKLSNDAICFDANGNLINGQHRIMAVVKSGVTCQFVVMRECDADIFKVMDRGRNRTLQQDLQMNGVRNCAVTSTIIKNVKMIREGNIWTSNTNSILKPNKQTMSPGELMDMYEREKEYFDFFASMSKKLDSAVCKGYAISTRLLASVWMYVCVDLGYSVEFSRKFFEGIVSIETNENKTINALRRTFYTCDNRNRIMTSKTKMMLLIKAWNMYAKGIEVEKILLPRDINANLSLH